MGTPFHYKSKTQRNASLGIDTILQRVLISQQWGSRNGCVWIVQNARAQFQLWEFLNMCQGGENASMWLGLCGNTMILQRNTRAACNIVMTCDLIPMIWWTLSYTPHTMSLNSLSWKWEWDTETLLEVLWIKSQKISSYIFVTT